MLLSGTTISDQIQNELKQKISTHAASLPPPHLTVILVGNNPASQTYVQVKRSACQKVGILSTIFPLPASISEKELLNKIDSLNADPNTHGILIQLPLPEHINQERVMEHIDPLKDVDGFHPINMGKLLLGISGSFIPCTPLGVKTLLDRYHITTSKKHVVIVGRSNIVGKPLAALLMQKNPDCNATVTVVHSQTQDLPEITKTADILVAAIGKPKFITADMIREGAVLIDVGINRIDDPQSSKGYRIVGDVDFQHVETKCSSITPVPKGIGPMTVAMLLQNTYQGYLNSISSR